MSMGVRRDMSFIKRTPAAAVFRESFFEATDGLELAARLVARKEVQVAPTAPPTRNPSNCTHNPSASTRRYGSPLDASQTANTTTGTTRQTASDNGTLQHEGRTAMPGTERERQPSRRRK